MRRTGPVVTVVAVLLLAGCAVPGWTVPDGLDGDLTGGWSAMPEPAVLEPEAGVCHRAKYYHSGLRSQYLPVACGQFHRMETVHVGRFGGEAADRVSPPAPGSPEMVEAYRECDTGAAEYLGADFRHGRLWLGVVRPSADGWDGGARWFRCDVGVWEDEEDRGTIDEYAGSLRGLLADEDPAIALGCYAPEYEDPDGGRIDRMNPVSCSEPHSAEFVGVWTAPDTSYDDVGGEDAARLHRGCRSVVADYVGVPDDEDVQYRTGTITWGMSKEDWEAGDRGFRCFLWLRDRELTESLEDAGTSGLPVS